MSQIPYRSFISSKPFLVVGPLWASFYAHSDLLAQSSPVFDRDVNGEMREKQLETIEIKDVNGDIDDDTWRLTVPDPDIVQLSTDSTEPQEAFVPKALMAPEDDWAVPFTGKREKKKKKRDSVLEWSSGRDLSTENPSPSVKSAREDNQHVQGTPGLIIQRVDSDRQKLWDSFCSGVHVVEHQPWRPRGQNGEREDYTNIFLCHARLYKFSDRYGCKQPMDLALQKLRLTLSQYIFYQQRAPGIVKLIQYTYAHTADFDHGHDGLRALVLDLTLCYYRELIEHPLFVELLQEGGSLSSDVMVGVAPMVS
ncbi:hypothetical protein LTR05_008595 [Lithohypha guttulata]|uniref:Uncharacterized protein n=1 Tax=Lithohypha guttulata TaxID=1690604 RepID=A0AAN7PQ70_9EURO|nr:hypothetical protein LTR05_008595 [Lithohypha guttulata]